MLSDFVAAWALFRDAFVTGWLLAALLGLAGVLVVARDQIFIGAAVAQASTFGIALALCLDGMIGGVAWLESDAVLTALAVVAAVTAALMTTRSPNGPGTSTPEALTGWVYLFAASAGILVVARSPHGLEEVHRLLSSSIIGASLGDVAVFGVLLVVAALVVARAQQPLLLLAVACGTEPGSPPPPHRTPEAAVGEDAAIGAALVVDAAPAPWTFAVISDLHLPNPVASNGS